MCIIHCVCDLAPIPIYHGMRVMITQNHDKKAGVANGQAATVAMFHNTTFLQLSNGNLVNTYPVTCLDKNDHRRTVYPFVPPYGKVQGQMLKSAIIWFDVTTVPAGFTYIALSRVKRLRGVFFMTAMQLIHFTAVQMEA